MHKVLILTLLLAQKLLLYSENYSSGRSPPQPGRNCARRKNKIRRCPAAQAQALLMLYIPNYLLSRQEKSLDLCLFFNTVKNKIGNRYACPAQNLS
jgi:hypothetical protein